MAHPEPLIADIIFKDPLDVILADVRFDFDPEPNLAVTVEPLLGSSGNDITIPIQIWFDGVVASETFVERVFDLPIAVWPNVVEDNLEVKFNAAGTTVKICAGSIGAPFERLTEFVLIAGEPHVILRAFDASDPITLRTWLVYHEIVAQLIKLNGFP